MSPAAPKRGRGLLLRVYVFGVLMSALATGASFLVGTYLFQPVAEGPSRPSTAWIAWHLIAIAEDREALRRELEDLKRRSHAIRCHEDQSLGQVKRLITAALDPSSRMTRNR